MAETAPNLVVLAGPNGAGKSTTADKLLVGALQVMEFVNADVIARGLSAFRPETAAVEAGRIMLNRLRYLATQRANFAFETTLSSRSFAPWIADLRTKGYAFHLFFLWLPSPEAAVARVAQRVRAGGHDIPAETIRRRYHRGLKNFFRLYGPLASGWRFFDNSSRPGPRLIASGKAGGETTVLDTAAWRAIQREGGHE
jgi:predicted ABC-type ATPase